MNNISLFEVARMLLSRNNYALLIHRHPDADAVGSAVALRLILEALGKNAEILCPDEAPAYLSFLLNPGERLAAKGCSAPREEKKQATVSEGRERKTYIAVDVAESTLLGCVWEEIGGKVLLKLDHHRTGKDFAQYNYTDPEACAAGEIVYELGKLLGVCSKEISSALYAAIASDTGCFRYSNTTARTLEIAADLYKDGIDAPKLNSALFESKALQTVRATAIGIQNARFFLEGGAVLSCFTSEMREKGGFCDENFSELSSALREISGVEVSATLVQNPDDPKKFRLSTRSKSFFDCCALCGCFDGGGHLRASGATVYAESPEEASRKVEEKIRELWKN